MAIGTRTAPTVSGTPTTKLVSYSVVDITGDKRSHSFVVAGAATNAQIEALIAAIQGGSASSVFEVRITDLYAGAANLNNASADGRPSADDKMYITLRDAANRVTKRLYVPSPEAGLFVANSEEIDISVAQFTALTAALTPLLGSFTFSTVAFVEHQESNTPQQL